MDSHRQYETSTLPWLLETDNPSVRYLTLRHLLGRPESDAQVQETRSAIPHSRWAARIFARQAAGGYWRDPTNPYLPKYKSTYWTLFILGHLSVNRSDERVERAVEHIFGFQQPDGGFAEYGAERAHQEYGYVAARQRARGKKPSDEASFVADHVRQMTLSCLTGNVVAAVLRLGYGDDPRLWRAVDWLVQIQHNDGGWLCPYWRAHVRDKHSCFYATIAALEGLAETPEDRRSPTVQRAISKGAEFLLMHRLYRADHHDGQVINPSWLKLAFPLFYGYSILRGLWVLSRLGYRDERMSDALSVLEQKRTPDGIWILESAPQGQMQTNLEKKGQPSKWLTLYALWTLALTSED
jgi:hypothetical protein